MRNKKAKRLRKENPEKKEPNYTHKDRQGNSVTTKVLDSRKYGYRKINYLWFASDKPKYAIPNHHRSGRNL